MRGLIFLAVLVLLAAACSAGAAETGTPSTILESTTTTTAPPASAGTPTVTTGPSVTTTPTAVDAEGFCPTVEAALAEVDAEEQSADVQLEDMWALLRSFYLRLQPVAPAELEKPIEIILSSAEHFEARARDPEGVTSPTEEEGDAFNAAIAEVMAYVETECGIPTVEAVPLG